MNRNLRWLLYCSFILAFCACKKLNPDEEIPSYITVPYTAFTADTVNQGTRLQQFSDVWVFNNDKFLGVFPLGSKIPILNEGNATIKMRAGIKNAGVNSLRSLYPVTQFSEDIVALKRGEVTTVIPTFSYFSGITFLKNENFSAPGTFLSQTPSSDTSLVQYSGPEAMPGQGNCGYVHLHDQYLVFDAQSGSSIPYQVQGAVCYAELHYKTNVPLYISVSDGSTDLRLCAQILPSSTWHKIYIPLTDFLNAPYTLYNFYFVMHASRAPGSDAAHIYFDNIKIIRQ